MKGKNKRRKKVAERLEASELWVGIMEPLTS